MELARTSNDRVAEAVRQHPTRFAAFAALPTQSPAQAADELTHRISEERTLSVVPVRIYRR